jgi:RimJ/RimL family protein N-acetyltransferase
MEVPALATERLVIRPMVMTDLDAVHGLYADLAVTQVEQANAPLEELRRWLEWTTLSYGELAHLNQPPYGDRAITLKASSQLIGVCGFVPLLDAFSRLPFFRGVGPEGLNSTEFGLYWAVAPAHQRRGYATEAARALVDYGFGQLRLNRIVATTRYENVASIGVMRRLGMRIERNPSGEPPWLQVVGVVSHPSLSVVEARG